MTSLKSDEKVHRNQIIYKFVITFLSLSLSILTQNGCQLKIKVWEHIFCCTLLLSVILAIEAIGID